jgi:hypothetical protein
MPEQIISSSGTQYGLIINSEGRALVNGVLQEEVPISDIYNNPTTLIQYSGTAIGSVWNFINNGSYVQVLSYDGSDNLIGVSKWVEV